MNYKNIKKKMTKYQWVFILIITVFVAMYLYGMTKVYFPDPVHLGAGQYLDLATGIILISLLLSGVIITLIFKKSKKGKK
ncbi:hypothetical protein LCGC14_1092570 [marine sediment metagenome]|uniref:Uncharacterized protein n=1 Tax=marine sediment metagenome TaxID=412755 RepID=A0A0F9MZP9_9ZZZZ